MMTLASGVLGFSFARLCFFDFLTFWLDGLAGENYQAENVSSAFWLFGLMGWRVKIIKPKIIFRRFAFSA